MRKTILLFSLAFIMCSCASTKRVTSTEQADIHKDVQAHLDSLVQQQVAAQLDRVVEAVGETVTEVIVFDTEKPATNSTGLPPVKAIVHRQTKQTQRSQAKAAVQAETQVQATSATTDRTTEAVRSEQAEEKKPSAGTGVLRTGIGALLLAVAVFAIWIFYKRIKR